MPLLSSCYSTRLPSIPFKCTQIKEIKEKLEGAVDARETRLRKMRKFIVRRATKAFEQCVLLSSFDSTDAMIKFFGAFSPSESPFH